MESKPKRKGGAEKIREKKKKNLEADAEKYAKITDMFSRRQPGHNIPGKTSTEENVSEMQIDEESETPLCIPGSASTSQHMEQNVSAASLCSHTDITDDPVSEEDVSVVMKESLPGQEGEKRQGLKETSSSPCTQGLESQSPFNYFVRPKTSQLAVFFKYHPKQDISDHIIMKAVLRRDGSNRKWLTYCEEQSAVFCSVCLAFSKTSATNSFIEGMTDRRHIHQRIEEHEKSAMHNACAEAYFVNASSADLNSLLVCNDMSVRREQVKKRRQILKRVIDIVKMMGKCGLSYEGSTFEAADTLEDISIDHGNFLELVLLLSKYDVCLQEHLSDCAAKSKTLHSSEQVSESSFTLLSKTTISKVIDTIGHLIQETVARDVGEAGMFSVQIDTTLGIASTVQCSVIVRYVTDQIHEKLLAVVDIESSPVEYFLNLVKQVVQSCKLDIKNCTGISTDGESHMQRQYKGFSTWLSTESPDQIHVWCYAHVLNLVLADTTKVAIASTSLFALMNEVAVFIRESYQCMTTWLDVSQDPHHRRLSVIGETRSNDAALRTVFGSFSQPDSALYIDLVVTLAKIKESPRCKVEVRLKAETYLESLLKYETILTAQIFLRIFELTSPLSDYLQTSGLDMLKAHRMVSGVQESLKKLVGDFDVVKNTADHFVMWANDKLQEFEDCDLEVQTTLPQKRLRKKKTMAGESAQDDVICDAITEYKIQVHDVILDVITECIDQRFLASGSLYADCACLDPRNFSIIRDQGLQIPAMENLSKVLVKFDESATAENLRCELTNLALHWEKFKTSVPEEYTVRVAREMPAEDQSTEGGDMEMELVNEPCASCKNCAVCCYHILRCYNLLADAYSVIGLAYKFILTLSFTQVACERSFSTLTFIKNRLRNNVSQEHLDSFMLMATEKDILANLDLDDIINRVAAKSEVLRSQLLP
ncbi:uncharacterized protein LOC142159784 [Mixophyes fleayi]|uniref:uncharacterized protein LOC142159784 n=1 Tax=Mixophyes fleayi TaxID=3061075 RepID=UPI003F4DE9F9